MKYTLLQMTQQILRSMDSDEVNSINDTVEAQDVAYTIQECYFDIVGKMDLPEHKGLFQLTASGDNTKPCIMTVPSNVLEIYKISYNTNTTLDPSWSEVYWVDWDEYMTRANSLDSSLSSTGSMTVTVDGVTYTFKFTKDRPPTIFSSPNEETLFFDCYDSSLDTTLQSAKTMCQGLLIPTFTMEDDFVPDLDARQFQLLLQSAKAQAFVEKKQIENPKAEKKERKNEILAQRTKDSIERKVKPKYIAYGRK